VLSNQERGKGCEIFQLSKPYDNDTSREHKVFAVDKDVQTFTVSDRRRQRLARFGFRALEKDVTGAKLLPVPAGQRFTDRTLLLRLTTRPGNSASHKRYFLNKFSNAVRASMGRAETGVEVSFSTRTRME
jgi:hypothetical protein